MSDSNPGDTQAFQHTLGGWLVDTRELTLGPLSDTSSRTKTELRPKVMQVLACLIANGGRLVTRDELIDEVWEGNHFVGENGLTDAIWQLRKHLDEDGQHAPYIQTIPKKGYRLLVTPAENHPTQSLQQAHSHSKIYAIGLSLFVIFWGIIGYKTWFAIHASGSKGTQDPIYSTISQIKGNETYPKISPNGKYVLYTHIASATQYQIFLKELNIPDAEARVLPVAEGLQSGFATWSADSDKIAFIASDLGARCEIRTYDLISNEEQIITSCETRHIAGLAWNSDTGLIAYSDKDDLSGTGVISVYNMQKQQKVQVSSPPPDVMSFDNHPAFSPSGNNIAFVRHIGVGNGDIYTTDLSGNVKRLTHWNTSIIGFTWTDSDNSLLISTIKNNEIELYHFAIDTQNRTLVNLNGQGAAFPSYHPAQQQLLYSKRSLARGLMALDINPTPNTVRVKSLFQSPGTDVYPSYSSISNRYALISNRNGHDELWLADSNEYFEQLTDLQTEIYSPAWSPDGTRIAFTAADTKNKYRQLFIVDVASGVLQQLTIEDTDHAPPTWSSDGQYIYSGVASQGTFYLWRYDLKGNGKQFLDTPAIYALDHPVNDTLLFTDMNEGGIYEYDFATENATKLIETNSRTDGSNWLTTDDGIYYVMRNDTQDVINFYEFAAQSHRTIMQFPAATVSAFQTLTLNPVTEELIYVQRFKQESDIHSVKHLKLPD